MQEERDFSHPLLLLDSLVASWMWSGETSTQTGVLVKCQHSRQVLYSLCHKASPLLFYCLCFWWLIWEMLAPANVFNVFPTFPSSNLMSLDLRVKFFTHCVLLHRMQAGPLFLYLRIHRSICSNVICWNDCPFSREIIKLICQGLVGYRCVD